jgi:hypothetical protein
MGISVEHPIGGAVPRQNKNFAKMPLFIKEIFSFDATGNVEFARYQLEIND